MRLNNWVVMFAIGCGGGVDLSDHDARCVTACKDPHPPTIEGVGAVCDIDSQSQCLDECDARIAETTTVCGSCLVDMACLTPTGHCSGGVSPGDDCSNGTTCTTTGPSGSCTYPVNDMVARQNCERQVDPRREVACIASFRSTAECNSSCL